MVVRKRLFTRSESPPDLSTILPSLESAEAAVDVSRPGSALRPGRVPE
nr:hypothetical protein [uncultured bacterium]